MGPIVEAVSSHLKLAVGGEDADPAIVVVGHHDVSVHVHGDARRPLQLPRGATSDPEAHLELAVVGENLQSVPSKNKSGDYRAAPVCTVRKLCVCVWPDLYALVVAVSHHHSPIVGG